jgi:hypothetical protein
MRLSPFIPALFIFLTACASRIPIEPLPDPDYVLSVTGSAEIAADASRPMTPDEIYPQIRLRAYEHAVEDTHRRMMAVMSSREVSRGIHVGDLMTQHRTVRNRAEQFLWEHGTEQPRWLWEDGRVEIDQNLTADEFDAFVNSIPQGYLRHSYPGDGSPPPDLVGYLPPPPEMEMSEESLPEMAEAEWEPITLSDPPPMEMSESAIEETSDSAPMASSEAAMPVTEESASPE